MTIRRTTAMAASLLLTAGSVAGAQAAQTTSQLDSTMRVAERAGFSGAVRIERAGTVLLEKGYGFANRSEKIPFTAATIVQIGSNTKDFTAVAILQLQQAGKLSLNDSIGKYFRDAPADKRDITIRQLMNHRAGFPHDIGKDFEPLGRGAFVTRAMETNLLFAPGTRESYSNTGFGLLAALIEQVTGTTYDVYVQRAILAPLDLHRTGVLLPGFKANELAHGYLARGTDNGTMLAKPHAEDGPYWNLRGNGGMLSTVGDMHAFYKELFEGQKLMTPATRALRFNPDEPIGLAGSDGVDFFLYDRFPRMRMEIIIASTNAASKAPEIRRALGTVLGLPKPDGDAGEEVARRPGGKPAPAAFMNVLTELVSTINSADTASIRSFIVAHFASEPGGPTVDERVRRFGEMHENLGGISIERLEMFDDGPFDMTLKSAQQGIVLVRVMADRAEPYRIHGMQVRLGG